MLKISQNVNVKWHWPGRRCWQWGRLCCPPHCRKWRAGGQEGRALVPEGGYLSSNKTIYWFYMKNMSLKWMEIKVSVALNNHLFIFLHEVCFSYFTVVLLGENRGSWLINHQFAWKGFPICTYNNLYPQKTQLQKHDCHRRCVIIYYKIPLPLGRSVYLCEQGCRTPGRQQSTGTWSNKAVQRECEQINLRGGKCNESDVLS